MDVVLDAVTPEEFDLVCGWLSDTSINRWLASEWRDKTVSPAVLAAALRHPKSRLLLVRADGAPVGLVALSEFDLQDGVAMAWYLLGRSEYGGRGITARAISLLVDKAFGELGLRCVYAWIASTNAPSRRVLEKNGFREAGRLRSCTRDGDRVVDRVYFDLLATDVRR